MVKAAGKAAFEALEYAVLYVPLTVPNDGAYSVLHIALDAFDKLFKYEFTSLIYA